MPGQVPRTTKTNDMVTLVSQDYRGSVAMIVSCYMGADLVVNASSYGEDRKASHAKVMNYCAGIGVSRQDLPAALLTKVGNWLATGDPEKDPSEAKAAKTEGRKRPAKSKEDKAPKKARGDGGRKRKST